MIKPTQDEMSFVHPLHEPLFLPVLLLLPSLGPSTLRELCLELSLRNLETITVCCYYVYILPVFILWTHYPSGRTWANILQFVWLCVSTINTGTRRIMRPEKLPFVVRRSRRISKESSSRHIMRLVPIFILETHNQTNYYVCPSSPRRIMRSQYKNGPDTTELAREQALLFGRVKRVSRERARACSQATTEPVIDARRYVYI